MFGVLWENLPGSHFIGWQSSVAVVQVTEQVTDHQIAPQSPVKNEIDGVKHSPSLGATNRVWSAGRFLAGGVRLSLASVSPMPPICWCPTSFPWAWGPALSWPPLVCWDTLPSTSSSLLIVPTDCSLIRGITQSRLFLAFTDHRSTSWTLNSSAKFFLVWFIPEGVDWITIDLFQRLTIGQCRPIDRDV